MGLAYGATTASKAECANRIAYVIGPDGKISQAYVLLPKL